MSTYYNDDFGDLKVDASGIYAKKGTAAERQIFYLEDPTGKKPKAIPYCQECIFTPDYVECRYGGASVRFFRKD